MVVLTRRIDEGVVLVLQDGRTVTLTVQRTGRHFGEAQAQLGIEAPRDVQVDRLEVAAEKALIRSQGTPPQEEG